MVDLVKIRKKAKKQAAEDKSRVTGDETAPRPESKSIEAEAEPLSTQHSALRTPSCGTVTIRGTVRRP